MSDSYDSRDCSRPGSSVHWIFQARILEWVAISFSTIAVDICQNSHMHLLVCQLYFNETVKNVNQFHLFGLIVISFLFYHPFEIFSGTPSLTLNYSLQHLKEMGMQHHEIKFQKHILK